MDARTVGRVLLSALLYNSAFIVPQYGYIGIFCCYIPVFTLFITHAGARIYYIMIWAFALYAVQWAPLVASIIEQSDHPIKFLFILCCFTWVIGIAGIAGIVTLLIARLPSNRYMRLVGQTVVWWIYLEFMYRSSFIWHGYPFGYPLVPLAVNPLLLRAGAYIPMSLLLLCLLIGQMSVVAAYHYRNRKLLLVTAFCAVHFAAGFFIPRSSAVMPRIHSCKPSVRSGNPLDDAQEIAKAIMKAGRVDYIIFPESTFAYDLSAYPDLLQMWQEYLPEQSTLIVGTQRCCNEQWQVAACYITKNTVRWHYKQVLVPLAEYMPTGIPDWWRQLFLKDGPTFYPAQDVGIDTVLICAELFLSKQKPVGDHPLIALVNDSWCCYWFANQLLLYARFKALEWGRAIAYCSHIQFLLIVPCNW